MTLSNPSGRIWVDLLAEHTGAADFTTVPELTSAKGIVDYLDRLAATASTRLRRHPSLDVDPAEYELLTWSASLWVSFDMEERSPKTLSTKQFRTNCMVFGEKDLITQEHRQSRRDGLKNPE